MKNGLDLFSIFYFFHFGFLNFECPFFARAPAIFLFLRDGGVNNGQSIFDVFRPISNQFIRHVSLVQLLLGSTRIRMMMQIIFVPVVSSDSSCHGYMEFRSRSISCHLIVHVRIHDPLRLLLVQVDFSVFRVGI